jgi:signal transduction histidine kinase
VVIVAFCCAVLTVVGYALSPGNLLGVTAIANRLLAFVAIGFVAFFGLKDRAAHITLQELWAQLAHANRVTTMGGLTASIAHEVRQPITGIVTNANSGIRWLAAQPPDLAEVRQALDRIVRDSHRADAVIDRIRALAQKTLVRKETLILNDLIEESVLLTKHELQSNRISVETQLAKRLSAIPGDRVQLQQVLLNLILNAIDAMKEMNEMRRELVVSSANESNGVLVEVRDTGKGLSQDDLVHLFDAFYTNKPGGMGMGLTISLSIAERHGGRLWATPNELHGATFHLWLPTGDQGTSPKH